MSDEIDPRLLEFVRALARVNARADHARALTQLNEMKSGTKDVPDTDGRPPKSRTPQATKKSEDQLAIRCTYIGDIKN